MQNIYKNTDGKGKKRKGRTGNVGKKRRIKGEIRQSTIPLDVLVALKE